MKSTNTVLIVDDCVDERYLLKRRLRQTELPLVVIEADSGQCGIDILSTPLEELSLKYPGATLPLTLFLDINMPVMTGWDFVKLVDEKYDEIQCNIKTIVIHSASDHHDEKCMAERHAMISDYLVKGEYSSTSLRQSIVGEL